MRLAYFILAWFALTTIARQGRAAEEIAPPTADRDVRNALEIETLDGRVLRGVLDARTDDEQLWVRQEAGAVVLATAVAWSDVGPATLDGAAVDVAGLKKRSSAAATAGPRWYAVAAASKDGQVKNGGDALNGKPRGRSSDVRRSHVRSVEIVNACLVNLDQDVEPDGLQVSIAAIDENGAPVAVRGSLTAQLYAERRPASVAAVAFGVQDRWTQPVAERDFVDGVATYELRFRRTAPEWQFDMLPDALLDVRLGAHGEGEFAASAPVLIRAFNPLRDNQQLLNHSRFLPGEWQGREPASSPVRRDGLWLHWTR